MFLLTFLDFQKYHSTSNLVDIWWFFTGSGRAWLHNTYFEGFRTRFVELLRPPTPPLLNPSNLSAREYQLSANVTRQRLQSLPRGIQSGGCGGTQQILTSCNKFY